jgi:hypothetical protein
MGGESQITNVNDIANDNQKLVEKVKEMVRIFLHLCQVI